MHDEGGDQKARQYIEAAEQPKEKLHSVVLFSSSWKKPIIETKVFSLFPALLPFTPRVQQPRLCKTHSIDRAIPRFPCRPATKVC